MENMIIETLVKIFATLLIMLIGVLGTYLTAQIGKSQKLSSIKTAVEATVNMAQLTAQELQQTVVEGLKNAHADGTLTEEEIAALGHELINKTLEKMDAPTQKLLNSVGVDICALIKGAGESWVLGIKAGESWGLGVKE